MRHDTLSALRLRLRALWRGRQLDRDLEDEMALHVAMREDANRAAGLDPEEAQAAARRGFGNLLLLRETCRDLWTFRPLEHVSRDLRYGLRMLRRDPGFTAVVVLTLALAVGATTAVFSLLDAGLLRVLPLPEPERLVLLHWTGTPENRTATRRFPGCNEVSSFDCSVPYMTYEGLSGAAQGVAEIAAFSEPQEVQIVSGGEASLSDSQFVSGNFFSVLGLGVGMGRGVVPSDDASGAEPVAVLSHEYWRQRFGGDPTIVGRLIAVNGARLSVVGVANEEFHGLDATHPPGMWIPLHAATLLKTPGSSLDNFLSDDAGVLAAIARLRQGVPMDQARNELTSRFRQLLAQSPKPSVKLDAEAGILLSSGARGLNALRSLYYKPLRLIEGLVGMVLLVACANIANLLLARASSRRREIAVRLAIGAGRKRLVAQMTTEGFLISFLGVGAGLVLGRWGTALLAHFLEPALTAGALAWGRPTTAVLGLAIGMASFTTLVFGLVPAWVSRPVDPARELHSGGLLPAGASLGERAGHLGVWLVTGEVALTLVLIVGAGLLVRTVVNVVSFDPGFRTDHLLTLAMSPVLAGSDTAKMADQLDGIRTRVQAVPGVASVTWASAPPLGSGWELSILWLGDGDGKIEMVETLGIGPRFFEVMKIPLLAGRGVEPGDETSEPHFAWVNRAFVERYHPNSDPLGKSIRVAGLGTSSVEIVGVVENTRYSMILGDIRPTVFSPTRSGARNLLVRTAVSPLNLAAVVEHAVRQGSPRVLVHDVRDQRQSVDEQTSDARLLATTALAFGGMALLLAAIGVYGVLSYSVSRRSGELAVRMALGAVRADILRLVLGEGLRMTVLGAVLGTLAAVGSTRLLAGFLFGVRPLDPLTFAGAILLLLALATVAAYLPANRATRVDPIVALRSE